MGQSNTVFFVTYLALGGGVGGGGAHAPGGHGFGGIRGLGSGRGFGGARLGLRGRGTRYSFGYRKQARRGYTWGPPGPRAGRFGRRPGGGIILAGVPAGGWGSDDFFLWNYGLYG